jgi:haloacetate dehalogenase
MPVLDDDMRRVVLEQKLGFVATVCPDGTPNLSPKRAMAQDQLELMRALGFERSRSSDTIAALASRGAWRSTIPTRSPGSRSSTSFRPRRSTAGSTRNARPPSALLLSRPAARPTERLIGAEPGFYLDWTLREWCGTPGALDEAAISEYRRCFDAATIHAGCEDYRAGATIDLAHDRADTERIHCPLLVLWSAQGIGSSYDVLAIWQQQADVVQGRALDCGHFVAEERPAETESELIRFLEQL